MRAAILVPPVCPGRKDSRARRAGLGPADIVGAIAGEADVPGEAIGATELLASQPLDRDDPPVPAIDREEQARVDPTTIEQNRARAAVAHVADLFVPVQVMADRVEERTAGLDGHRVSVPLTLSTIVMGPYQLPWTLPGAKLHERGRAVLTEENPMLGFGGAARCESDRDREAIAPSAEEAKSIERVRSFPLVVWVLAFAAYLAAAKVGLILAFIHASASAVWPPTGIAIAIFLVLGLRMWPAIFSGAFVANVTTAGSVATSLGIALGNTLEGLLAASLVNRFAGGRHAFDRPEDVVKYAALAGMGSTMVSATVGVTSLALGGYAPWALLKSIWFTWWLGDAVGAIVVAPLLVLWANDPVCRRWYRPMLLEAALLLGVLVLVGQLVFGSGPWTELAPTR
jgi:hypothetical protein